MQNNAQNPNFSPDDSRSTERPTTFRDTLTTVRSRWNQLGDRRAPVGIALGGAVLLAVMGVGSSATSPSTDPVAYSTPLSASAPAAPAAPQEAAKAPAQADQILEGARADIGTKETGENCQKYSSQCVSWCALFAMTQWKDAGVDVNPEQFAFTGNVYETGKDKGTAYDSDQLDQARPGDVLLFGTGPSTAKTSKHIGLVEKVDGDTVTMIEGNSGPNTDQVVRKEHKLSADTFYGGVHPW